MSGQAQQHAVGPSRSPFRACVEDAVRDALSKAAAIIAGFSEEARALVAVTFALMADAECVSVAVPRGLVARFLHGVGRKTARTGFIDVQFWLQDRAERGQDDPTIHGIVIDVDQKHDDIGGVLQVAGVPLPNFYFFTKRGARLCYLFSTVAPIEAAETFAAFLVLAIPGADPTSARVSQAQRVPGCERQDSNGEIVPTPADIFHLNGSYFDLGAWEPQLPRTFTVNVPGARAVGAADRLRVAEHLAGLGIVVPPAGSALQSRCPLKTHSAKKAYVNVSASGAISMYCCGGHAGAGPRRWGEHELLVLTHGSADARPAHFDVVTDVPYVWGGVEMIRSLASDIYANEVGGAEMAKLALLLWKHVKTESEVRRLLRRTKSADPGAVRDALAELHRKRLHGVDDAGPMRLFFCENTNSLALLQADNTYIAITGASFPVKAHLHERWSTTAARVKIEVSGTAEVSVAVAVEDAESKFDKAMRGLKSMLRSLGIPVLRAYQFPLAHRRTSISVDAVERNLGGILVPELTGGDPTFDVIGFLDALREDGRLPLASRDDVIRFTMMLAAPLLREVAPGLLGVFWILGPSGAGKLFLYTCAETAWTAGAKTTEPAGTELSVTDELELKRSFAAAGDALYVHAPEASKRAGMVDSLIHLSGSQFLASRGMRQNEVRIRNTFTFVADSVEDLVDRREIHRRTVVINVKHTADDKGKGVALRLIGENAHHILAALKAKVESQPESWYREQDRAGTRPVIPVALARLFGVELPEVTGGGLHDLFEAMHDYVDGIGKAEGDREKKKSQKRKDGAVFSKLPSYRIDHFLDEMRERAGHRVAMSLYGSRSDVINVLRRETDYRPGDRSGPGYLPVELNGDWFALKVGRANRNFVFVPEPEYCTAAGIPTPLRTDKNAGSTPDTAATSPSASTAPTHEATDPGGQLVLVANFDEVASWDRR